MEIKKILFFVLFFIMCINTLFCFNWNNAKIIGNIDLITPDGEYVPLNTEDLITKDDTIEIKDDNSQIEFEINGKKYVINKKGIYVIEHFLDNPGK